MWFRMLLFFICFFTLLIFDRLGADVHIDPHANQWHMKFMLLGAPWQTLADLTGTEHVIPA